MAKKRTKYQDGARGQDCQLRLPGCTNDRETVVLCHIHGWMNKRIGFGVIGWGRKDSDQNASDGCYHCHNSLDHPDRYADREMIVRHYLTGRNATRANRERRGIE